MIFDSEIDPAGTNTLTNVQLLLWPLVIVTWTGPRPAARGTPSHVTRTVCQRPASVLRRVLGDRVARPAAESSSEGSAVSGTPGSVVVAAAWPSVPAGPGSRV